MHMQNLTFSLDTSTKQLLDTFNTLREMLSRCNVTDAYTVRIYVHAEAPSLMMYAAEPMPMPEIELPAEPAKDSADPYRDQLEVITRDELSALLNEYAGKHPGKTKAAREVLGSFGGMRLSDVAEEDWPKIAQVLRAYIGAH